MHAHRYIKMVCLRKSGNSGNLVTNEWEQYMRSQTNNLLRNLDALELEEDRLHELNLAYLETKNWFDRLLAKDTPEWFLDRVQFIEDELHDEYEAQRENVDSIRKWFDDEAKADRAFYQEHRIAAEALAAPI